MKTKVEKFQEDDCKSYFPLSTLEKSMTKFLKLHERLAKLGSNLRD